MNSVKHFLSNPAEIRKSVSAFLACVALGVGAKVLPTQVGDWLQVIQPLLIAYGVYQVPNADCKHAEQPPAA